MKPKYTTCFDNGVTHPHLGIYDDCCGPHCDVRILHEPGLCDSCDKFPHYQKARELWGIQFTRPDSQAAYYPPHAVLADPAEMNRPVSMLNLWHGNQTSKQPYAAQIAELIVGATDPEEIEEAIDQLRAVKKELEEA